MEFNLGIFFGLIGIGLAIFFGLRSFTTNTGDKISEARKDIVGELSPIKEKS